MTKMMTTRPPEELREALKAIAKTRGLTVNALVISIFWDFVERNKKGEQS